MVLVDTSVWIDHLRQNSPHLVELLTTGTVLCHEFIIGELACGSLQNREGIIALMNSLPKAKKLEGTEFYTFLAAHRLYSQGIGFVDVHLLASALLSNALLWTFDKRLLETAKALHISYEDIHGL